MKTSWWRILALVLALAALSALAVAQAQAPAATATSSDPFDSMRFRNLGPAVGGGRVAAVAGVPGQPGVYYVGAAGGGVWKTTDNGLTWRAIFEKESTSSIGAIAVAPSNPGIVWVGTGETNPRNDVITGKGIFFSPDGGLNWKCMGLENVGQITQIVIHPSNPDIVYAGVLGHVWGPNKERGVYRTKDGGKTWEQVLFVDDKTGVSDLVMDASNPLVLFAGLWHMERYPWMLISGGESSGVYRSTDGGSTWNKLTEGLPRGVLGRIGLAVAASNPNHVYALIQTKQPGALWESLDLGEHWRIASSNKNLIYRGFYFTTLYVSPENENHLYFLSFGIMESTDGGRTVQTIGRGVHPDHHSLWIDPKDPNRMVEGNDGGVYISSNGGKVWTFLDDIPIEQFYMVAADDDKPYLLCGGLQDNNGWCGPSATLGGRGVTGADWWTATGGDGEYIVPAGNKSGIIYAESQNGSVQRLDAKTGVSDQVRPYLHGVEDFKPADLKYRFNWTTPIAVSPADPKTVYIGGNVLFKSTDGGLNWTPISKDLTRNDKSKQEASGGPVDLDMSGAETFDTLLAMAISPTDEKVIWTGSDDGVISLTKDGGQNWTNVTPKGAPEWCRLQQIEVSPFSPDTAYAAFDCHEMDNNKPYAYRTHDGGKTWTSIANGLPANDPARVIRENPNKKGMLVLGTDTGLFHSYDDGDHWTPLKNSFPTVPVYDLKFVKASHDLLVATHGRGLFVLDDITPIEEFSPQVAAENLHLFPSLTAQNWRRGGRGRGFGGGEFTAPNPMQGAVITYYLAKEIAGGPGGAFGGGGGRGGRGQGGGGRAAEAPAEAPQAAAAPQGFPGMGGFGGGQQGPVKIVITDSTGATVRTMYGPGRKGINRVSWNMRYDDGPRFTPPGAAGGPGGGGRGGMGGGAAAAPGTPEAEMAAMFAAMGGFGGGGPAALPGTYKVTVTAAGETQTGTVVVEPDPRFPFDVEVAKAQLKAAFEVRGWVTALNETLTRVENLKAQIATVQRVLAPMPGEIPDGGNPMNTAYAPVLQQARALQRRLTTFEDKLYNSELAGDQAGRLHALGRFQDRLNGAYRAITQPYNAAPNAMVQEELAEVKKLLDGYLAEFNAMLGTDVQNFNKLAVEKGAATLFAGSPVEIKSAGTRVGGGSR
jgi:photosystem II stability/assembly factor-like uncharacterized protein